jgi:hypothetical protein
MSEVVKAKSKAGAKVFEYTVNFKNKPLVFFIKQSPLGP